jgi:copper chaperone CopZ
MEKVDVEIDGMTCGHCVMSVTEEFSDIGVGEVSIDLVKGGTSTAHLVVDSTISDSQLTEAIREAGYQVSSIKR